MAQLAVICGVKREAFAALKGCPDISLIIYVTGVRQGRGTELALSALRDGAEGLVSFGTCGALDPSLKPGDVIIPDGVISPLGEDFPCDGPWVERLRARAVGPNGPGGPGSRMFGSQHLVDTPLKKANLLQDTGALAVDMESHEIAEVAAQERVPFVVARAVSDTAETAIPSWLAGTIGKHGQVKMMSMLVGMAVHPGDMGALMRLGRESGPAIQSLRRVAGLLIPSFTASR